MYFPRLHCRSRSGAFESAAAPTAQRAAVCCGGGACPILPLPPGVGAEVRRRVKRARAAEDVLADAGNDDASSARQPYSAEARRRRIIARSGPREGFRRLGDSVQAWWRESGLARRGREAAIHDAIHAALGSEYGRHARVVKFTLGENYIYIVMPITVEA